MSLYYLETSALVKYYAREPGTTWITSLIDAIDPQVGEPAHKLLVATANIVEVSAALSVLYRTKAIRYSHWQSAYDRFFADLEHRLTLLHVLPTDFYQAAELTRQHPLKAYDAIHLAIALRQNSTLRAHGFTLMFVSGDRTLLTAAQAEELSTENSFDHALPEDTPHY